MCIRDSNSVENNETNCNVFEELVSEVDTMKISNENTDKCVECDYEMLMCVNELEREWRESYIMAVSYTHLYYIGSFNPFE